jgi:hypothetical protein
LAHLLLTGIGSENFSRPVYSSSKSDGGRPDPRKERRMKSFSTVEQALDGPGPRVPRSRLAAGTAA